MTSIYIVTPVYNGVELISDTLQSIVDQKNLDAFDLHYTVCDGGSNDGTLELLNSWADKFKAKNIHFTLISEPDHGMYDALAKGFKQAGNNHDIYTYINAGDYYAPYAFREVMRLLKGDTAWVTGVRTLYNNEGVLIETRTPAGYPTDLIQQGFFGSFLPYIQQESTFWTGRLQQTIDLEKLKQFKYAGDFYLWQTFSKHAELFTVKAWLSGFRLHSGQLSEKFSQQYTEELQGIAMKKTLKSWVVAFYFWLLLKLPLGIRLKLAKNIIKI